MLSCLREYGLRSWFHDGDRYNHPQLPKHALMFGLAMEAPPEPEGYLTDGEMMTAAGVSLEVIAVPGHSPGGVAFYSEGMGSSSPVMPSLQEA